AYVERGKQTPEEVVEMLVGVGGLSVLAHPRDLDDLGHLLTRLKAAGLIGVEVYYPDYTPEVIQRLLAMANEFDLVPLGGSDYHGLGGPQQRELGDIPLPTQPVERLLSLARERGIAERAAP
ncbi:MAG: PHP domain-containing protein, partial [Dehalococcoidia bacterium]